MSSSPGIREVYFNRRMAVMLALGFSSGLPLMLTQDTMQAWLAQNGVNAKEIGLFSLVGLPYSLKFLWAPLLDRFVPPGLARLGRRRGWMLVTQLGLVAAVLAMAVVSPRGANIHLAGFEVPWVILFGLVATVVAFLSASQDIVIDAYRTDLLAPRELGAGAAMNVNGYRVGMLVAGGGAMAFAAHYGFPLAYAAAAGLLLVGLLATLTAPDPTDASAAPLSLGEAIVRPFHQFFQRLGGRAWLVLIFILFFKIPEVTVSWQAVPFLTKSGLEDHAPALWAWLPQPVVSFLSMGRSGLGFAVGEVGFARGVLGVTLTIAGALAGGAVVARVGLRRALWIVGALGALSNAGFLLLAITGNSHAEITTLHLPGVGEWTLTRGFALMAGVVGLEAFCLGLVNAGFVAFLMSQCDRRYSATQYALLSSVMGLTGVLFRTPTGYVVEAMGWPGFFAATILVGIPGMALIPWLKFERDKPPQ